MRWAPAGFLLLVPIAGRAQAPGEWVALLQLGGPVVLILLAMSVVALAVSLYKILQFRGYSSGGLSSLDGAVDLWCSGQVDDARQAAASNRCALAAVLDSGMAWLSAPGSESRREFIEAELTRMAQQHLARMSSMLGVLEQVSYLAPLLGLLGTVLGIIDVFHGLAEQGASADAGSLAGGIWEALLTTAVGLCVAIPFALLHAGFQGRVDSVRNRLQDQLTRILTVPLYRAGPEAG
jgi:biopolymer transport protein ExbB